MNDRGEMLFRIANLKITIARLRAENIKLRRQITLCSGSCRLPKEKK